MNIKGDIRTTVEYIIKMLQSDDFIKNKFDTDWLDGRLAIHQELMAEVFICIYVYIVDELGRQ